LQDAGSLGTLIEEMASSVEPTLRTRRWTRAEYERLIELGLFDPSERLELLDGALVVREPQGSRHAAAIRKAVAALRAALGDAWQIDSQLPLAVDDASLPEPDVFVVPPDPNAYRHAHPSRPVLVVEVAETSYRTDRAYKFSLYARAGIVECWLVDVANDAVEIHREPEASPEARYGWHYRSVETLRPPATVRPVIAPDRAIRAADLLP
jgi:Uma2 family endonuclease